MTRVTLAEYTTSEVDLCEGDVVFLTSRLSRQFTTRRSIDGQLLINPNQFVGVVRLPSGLELDIRSKVPVSNLLRMLMCTLGMELLPELAGYSQLNDLLEFVVRHFLDLVEARMERGLHRDYVDREENLGVVRGRIDFRQDLQHNWALRHRSYCRYSDFTWDVQDNQLIRHTIRWLKNWRFGPETMARLASVDALMEEVTPTTFRAADVALFTYHRLNADYRPIHQLCRLFLDGASVNEDAGEFELRAFLVDMNALFEGFVRWVFSGAARPPWSVGAQQTGYLGQGQRVAIRPDLAARRYGRLRLIADSKYKRIAPDTYRNYDLYQIVAYCVACRASRGALIYPKHELEVDDVVRVLNSDVEIRLAVVDLGQPWEGVMHQSTMVVESLFAWSTPVTPQAAVAG